MKDIIITVSFILLIVTYLVMRNYNNKKMKSAKLLIKQLSDKANTYNYELDTQFLFYIIGYKCKVYTEMVLNPMENIQSKLLNDDELNNAVEKITIDIYKLLSDDYKNLLSKYFKVDKNNIQNDMLFNFITENVLNTMLNVINNKNERKIKKINTINKIENMYKQQKDIDIE